jgi:hypothetical protein
VNRHPRIGTDQYEMLSGRTSTSRCMRALHSDIPVACQMMWTSAVSPCCCLGPDLLALLHKPCSTTGMATCAARRAPIGWFATRHSTQKDCDKPALQV